MIHGRLLLIVDVRHRLVLVVVVTRLHLRLNRHEIFVSTWTCFVYETGLNRRSREVGFCAVKDCDVWNRRLLLRLLSYRLKLLEVSKKKKLSWIKTANLFHEIVLQKTWLSSLSGEVIVSQLKQIKINFHKKAITLTYKWQVIHRKIVELLLRLWVIVRHIRYQPTYSIITRSHLHFTFDCLVGYSHGLWSGNRYFLGSHCYSIYRL